MLSVGSGRFEEEVVEQEAQDPTEEVATQETENFAESKSKDDHDYKKRYDDLKKHYDNKLQEWKSEKEALEATAEKMNLDPSVRLPKSPEELEDLTTP